jgi:response regulator NasT
MRDATLRILIYDENTIRASILEEGLREAGLEQIAVVTELNGIVARIAEFDPQVIFLDLANPNRDRLESMLQVSRSISRPIAVFVDEADSATIDAAVDAGVSAYIVDGLKKERVTSILDITISRFNAFNRLKSELEEVRTELADRKVVDQAKLLLIKRRGITEDEAYALLRRTAMSRNCRIAEVAHSLVVAADLFPEDKL